MLECIVWGLVVALLVGTQDVSTIKVQRWRCYQVVVGFLCWSQAESWWTATYGLSSKRLRGNGTQRNEAGAPKFFCRGGTTCSGCRTLLPYWRALEANLEWQYLFLVCPFTSMLWESSGRQQSNTWWSGLVRLKSTGVAGRCSAMHWCVLPDGMRPPGIPCDDCCRQQCGMRSTTRLHVERVITPRCAPRWPFPASLRGECARHVLLSTACVPWLRNTPNTGPSCVLSARESIGEPKAPINGGTHDVDSAFTTPEAGRLPQSGVAQSSPA